MHVVLLITAYLEIIAEKLLKGTIKVSGQLSQEATSKAWTSILKIPFPKMGSPLTISA